MEATETKTPILSKEVVGFLLDHAISDPKERREVKELASEIQKTYLELYGKYIPDDKKKEREDLPKRIILLKDADYDTYVKMMWPESYGAENKTAAHFFSRGNYIGLNIDSVERYVHRHTDFNRKDAIAYYLAHEISHAFENSRLTISLREIGAQYYTRMVMKKVGLKIPVSPRDEIQAELYKEVLDEARAKGVSMHKVYFGSANPQEWQLVLPILKSKSNIVKEHMPDLIKRHKHEQDIKNLSKK